MNKKGFSILELLITIVITAILFSALYYTYINLFKKSKTQIYAQETEIEKNIGLELLRLDVEHAGFGILDIEECPSVRWGDKFPSPVDCDDDLSFSNNVLVIRSMINNTNTKEIGWVYVDCTSGSWPSSAPNIIDERVDKTNNNLIFFDATSGYFAGTGTFGSCIGNNIYLAYPYDDITNMLNCKTQQYCHRIVYKLASSSTDSICHPNTKNLIRGIDGTASSGGSPVLSCIGGFQVLFDIDLDNDGVSDLEYQDYNQLDLNADGEVSADEVMKGLKRIHIYLLMQVGKKDPGYRFPKSKLSIAENTGRVIEFDLPSTIGSDYINYKWRLVKISVNPMNLQK